MVLPPEYGGYGLPVLTAIRALHRLGEGCRDNGMLLGINGQLWAMQMSILEFGSEAQKQHWLPRLVDGRSICCHMVTEEGSGSSAMSIKTRAERTDDGYRLSGEKTWIGMGSSADLGQVFAVTNPDHGAWGLSAFLIDLNQPGVHKETKIEKAGHRTVPAGPVSYTHLTLPTISSV